MILLVSKRENIFVRKKFTQVNGEDVDSAKNNDLFTWREQRLRIIGGRVLIENLNTRLVAINRNTLAECHAKKLAESRIDEARLMGKTYLYRMCI